MPVATYQQRQLDRLERLQLREAEISQARKREVELIKGLWDQPAFKALLESWDRRYDAALLLAIDPSVPGWEPKFIALRHEILAYWEERKRLLRIVNGEETP